MAKAFGNAMLKLSLVGQDKSKMIDCSEVIPQAKPLNSKAHFPAGLSIKDLDQTVSPPECIVDFILSLHTLDSVQEALPSPCFRP